MIWYHETILGNKGLPHYLLKKFIENARVKVVVNKIQLHHGEREAY
jgi:hypothetical protein